MPNLVVLTGAGISAESGVATFRDANGLWERHRIEDVASPAAFQRDPALVHRFYNLRRAQLNSVAPNAAHFALAALERRWADQGDFLLVTQNVDDLHERANSRKLLHMHGEIRKLRCTACNVVVYHERDADTALGCAGCGTTGFMRPDIVWFGEMPYHMERIAAAIGAADIFVAIGTSGVVYPAAAFAGWARANQLGCATVEINPNPTAGAAFQTVIAAPAVPGVQQWIEAMTPAASGA